MGVIVSSDIKALGYFDTAYGYKLPSDLLFYEVGHSTSSSE